MTNIQGENYVTGSKTRVRKLMLPQGRGIYGHFEDQCVCEQKSAHRQGGGSQRARKKSPTAQAAKIGSRILPNQSFLMRVPTSDPVHQNSMPKAGIANANKLRPVRRSVSIARFELVCIRRDCLRHPSS